MKKRLFAAICAVTWLASCGNNDGAQRQNGPAIPPQTQNNTPTAPIPSDPTSPIVRVPTPNSLSNSTIVLLVSGGKGSCKNTPAENYMHPMLEKQISLVTPKSKNPVKYFLTCFGSSPEDVSFTTEAAPTVLNKSNRTTVLQNVMSQISQIAQPVVYITGHSYGGWLAMMYAASLPQNATARVLLTIDPIGGACQTANYFPLFGVGLTQILSGTIPRIRQEVPNCNTFPQDFQSNVRMAIRQRMSLWVNYFQMDFIWLHSSAIPEVDPNNIIRPASGGNAHNLMGTEQQTRDLAEQKISLDLQSL